MPQPAHPSASEPRLQRIDALAAPVRRAPYLGVTKRVACYLAGRADGARLEWVLQHGQTPEPLAWHWHERNNRGFHQAALQRRIELEERVAPAGRELRHLLTSVRFVRADVDANLGALVEHDARAELELEAIVRTPGEERIRGSIVLSRRQRARRKERGALVRAYDASRLQLEREEERITELRAVIRLAIHRTVGEVEQLRAFFGRRAEVAARGLTNRSAAAASALGLLQGVASLERPAWVGTLEDGLLPAIDAPEFEVVR